METLSNLIRLSYWPRIHSVVPAGFHELLPPCTGDAAHSWAARGAHCPGRQRWAGRCAHGRARRSHKARL